jgi:hypothetical protein
MSGLRVPILVILVILVAGCNALPGPVQLASYPKLTPIAKYPPDPIIYQTYIEVLVNDVDRAAEIAMNRASAYQGYLISTDSWYSDGQKVISLQLAVPTYNFENLRNELINLGQVMNENMSGKPANPLPYDRYIEYSQITLQLRSTKIYFSPVEPPGWDPTRTLRNAFSVFLSIFGFIADILIWILVVAGPFLLIGLGIGAILRTRRKSKEDPIDPEEK